MSRVDLFSEHRVGDGEKRIPLSLGGVPVMAAGLERWPRVGDLNVIAGQAWRAVEVSDRLVCEVEPS